MVTGWSLIDKVQEVSQGAGQIRPVTSGNYWSSAILAGKFQLSLIDQVVELRNFIFTGQPVP
jgi:hypothetical protein